MYNLGEGIYERAVAEEQAIATQKLLEEKTKALLEEKTKALLEAGVS
jgi:hypothetical protein